MQRLNRVKDPAWLAELGDLPVCTNLRPPPETWGNSILRDLGIQAVTSLFKDCAL
jgi:hypothetical protein